MEQKKQKSLSIVKVGTKGQIVIPNDIRKMFDIKTGDSLLVMADLEKGIGITKPDEYIEFANQIFKATKKD